MCTIALNPELNGVELYFEGKPDRSIIDALKEVGYRWHRSKMCWYAKQNEKTMEKANQFATETTESKNTNQTENKEPFYPDYDKVGHANIYKSSEGLSIYMERGGYFADLNCYVWMHNTSGTIIDLTNAMQTGKECKRYLIEQQEWKGNDYCTFANLLNDNGIKTIRDAVEAVREDRELTGLKINKGSQKSVNTFSPFVEVKPIKTPEKWTKNHVWKAILAGQIFRGVTDYHYTDDYAYDNATGFSEGCGVYLPDVAQDLIENGCKGIHIYPSEAKDGVIPINYSTYSYDSKTLYFDETCNHEKKHEILRKRREELENFNKNLEDQIISLQESDIQEHAIYNVTYLETNNNTGRYKTVTELMYSGRLFYEGECNYQIISCEEFIPEDNKLYEISNFHERPYGDHYKDKRIIDLGNWKHVVTGYALKELREEGYGFATIRESAQTIEQAKAECASHINGSMMWIFGEDKTDYKQSLFRLNAEELRITEKENELCICL